MPTPTTLERPVYGMSQAARLLGLRTDALSGRSLALKVQKQVGLDPSLNIVVLGRDGTLQLTDTAEAFLEKVDFAAGETRERVAAVYDITVDDVDAAVRYENDRAA